MIYIASDHGGFKLKQSLVKFLKTNNYDVQDMGPQNYDEKDDYPDYVIPVVRKVQESVENKGVLICRNGVGVCMLANKMMGIRAGISWNPKHARSQRNDDDTNVLALPANYVCAAKAKRILKSWLETYFSSEERHVRRLEKIYSYDNTGNI
ncbi:MAG: RpiB/LacA/LacB family sugar-phosphate isomerase [Patescibacteria group bacterium]|jgi:ribose 5-phosphate isomerase B